MDKIEKKKFFYYLSQKTHFTHIYKYNKITQ